MACFFLPARRRLGVSQVSQGIYGEIFYLINFISNI